MEARIGSGVSCISRLTRRGRLCEVGVLGWGERGEEGVVYRSFVGWLDVIDLFGFSNFIQ